MKLQCASIFIAMVTFAAGCDKPKQETPPPIADEDNSIMQIPASYADKDENMSLTFDRERPPAPIAADRNDQGMSSASLI